MSRERVRGWNGAMFHHPFAGLQVPPDIRVKDDRLEDTYCGNQIEQRQDDYSPGHFFVARIDGDPHHCRLLPLNMTKTGCIIGKHERLRPILRLANQTFPLRLRPANISLPHWQALCFGTKYRSNLFSTHPGCLSHW